MVWSEILGAVRRRWYVAAVGAVLTAMLGWLAVTFTAPAYTTRGLMVIYPARESIGQNGNPFLAMSGLELPAQVLVSYYSSAPEQERIAKFAPDADVTVSMEDSTRGPVIAVDVEAPSAKTAVKTLDFVADSIPGTLDNLQSQVGAKKKVRLRARPLTLDHDATRDNSGPMRMTVVAVVAGLAGSAAGAYAVDGVALRRRSAKAQPGEGDADLGDDEDRPYHPDRAALDARILPYDDHATSHRGDRLRRMHG